MSIGAIFINKKLKGNKIMKKKFKDMIFVKGGKYTPHFIELFSLTIAKNL